MDDLESCQMMTKYFTTFAFLCCESRITSSLMSFHLFMQILPTLCRKWCHLGAIFCGVNWYGIFPLLSFWVGKCFSWLWRVNLCNCNGNVLLT